MKKIIYILQMVLILNISSNILNAQDTNGKDASATHKIIFQMVSGDTLTHKQLMKQLNNIQKIAPGSMLEVVCHGPGLDMLITGKSIVEDKVSELAKSGVQFNACEFSMKERKIEKSLILPGANTVPAGIIEIVTKQEQGWSYIKAGF